MTEQRPVQRDGSGPDELDPGLKAAFARSPVVEGPSNVLEAVARLTGSAPKVVLRDATDGTPAPLLQSVAESGRPEGRTGYQVLGEIARGGMGVILRGHDPDLGRDVAMKVLHEKLANRPELVQRFVEEAQIGGQLQHPGIVPVYELGLMADQRPYFTMKLVKGRTLAALLAERTEVEDRRKLLDVFEAVCQTMAYAHSRGVIHRDLKPANVMVGAFGEVQVVDWGLAKVLRRGGVADEQRQRAAAISIIETVRSAPGSAGSQSVVGSVLGTPAYMPPEQARGDVEHLDERSDVFSLGAILCEILTGQPPYVGAEEHTIVLAAQGKLEDAVTRIDGCGADAELIALCRQCLMPAPPARPRSAEVLAEKLHGYLTSVEQRAQTARIEAAEAKVHASAERKARRLTTSLAAAVLALMLLGGGGYWWLEQRELDQRRATEQAVTAALNDATLARGRADWPAAHAALDRAEARLDAGNATAALRDQVATARHGIEREAAAAAQAEHLRLDNAALLAAFQDVRQPEGDKNYPRDWARLDERYRAAADEHAIDVDAGETAMIVEARRDISGELAAAFDEWALVRNRAGDLPGAARVAALASALDADPFRAGLRASLAACNLPGLRRVASSAAVATLPAPSLRLLALGLMQGEGIDQAVAVLEAGRLRFPQDFSLAMELGRALHRLRPHGNTEGVAHFSAAVTLRPESVEAWHELGRTLDMDAGLHEQAVLLFRAACAHWQADAHLHWHLGRALAGKGDNYGAVTSYRLALDLDPKSVATLTDLGLTLTDLEQWNEAIECYQHALALDDKSTAALTNYGIALDHEGDRDAARDKFERALAIDEDCVDAHVNLGVLFAKQDRLDEAVEQYGRALKVDPRHAKAHRSLGNARFRKQDYAGAIDSYHRALEFEPRDVDVLTSLGAAFRCSGQPEQAIASCRQAIAIDPKFARAHTGLGQVYLEQRAWDLAIASFQTARAIGPQDADAYTNLGFAFASGGDLDHAEPCFARAVDLDPRAPAYVNLGLVQARQGHPDQAIVSFEHAKLADSKFVDAWYNLGFVLLNERRFNQAIVNFQQVLVLDSKHIAARYRLGNALAASGDHEAAVASYRKAMALGCHEPQMLNEVAWWLATRTGFEPDDAQEAVRCAQSAVRQEPFQGPFWNTLGVAQYRAGEFTECAKALGRSIELTGGDGSDWLFLAMAQHRLGNADEDKSYRRALDWWSKQAQMSEELQRFRAEAEQVLGIKPEPKRD